MATTKNTFRHQVFLKTKFPFQNKRGHSHMDSFTVSDQAVFVSGWAFFDASNLIVNKVLVFDFVKQQIIGVADVPIERKDVHDVYENAPVVCGFQFEIPVKFCPKDPEHSLMFYGIDMDCEVYMKIYGIYRMLPLAPFKKIREDIPDNILKYLTVSKLAWVDITATHKCNIDCSYCCLHGKHLDSPDANIENLLKIVDTSDDLVGYWQMSCLGEITMYPYWLTLARKIYEKKPFSILSNFCKKFNDEELLMLAKAKYITISIDTTDRNLHKIIRKGSDVARIVSNIVLVKKVAKKINLPIPIIDLSAVVSRQVVPYLPSLAILAVSLDARHILIQDISAEDATDNVSDELSITNIPDFEEKILKKNIQDMLNIFKDYNILYTLLGSLRRFDAKYINNSPLQVDLKTSQTKMCLAPWQRMYIGLKGEVVPCAHIGSVGYIKDSYDLKKIVNGARMQAIRKGLLTGKLEECCAVCRYGRPCNVEELINRIDYYKNPDNTKKISFGLFD